MGTAAMTASQRLASRLQDEGGGSGDGTDRWTRAPAPYPDRYETVNDQFVLGTEIVVAPVLVQGAVHRNVALPDGRWRADDGVEYDGGQEIVVDAPLARLPWFERVSE